MGISFSLLRPLVEQSFQNLGTTGQWTWKPQGSIQSLDSRQASPTTEYSTEGDED